MASWANFRMRLIIFSVGISFKVKLFLPDEILLGQAVHADFAGPNTLGKFRRYEAHNDRTLYKALHELQRLQAARLGHKVAAPVAIDIDISKTDV